LLRFGYKASATPLRLRLAGIKPHLDLGFAHLVFHAPGPDQERFLWLYAKEVLPRLRELSVPAGVAS
jgi:hypothetical protein